jgi:hypothetical protein
MTTRTISEWETLDNRGKAVVKYHSRSEMFIIDYYDDQGHWFFNEEYPNKALCYVEDAARNWVDGIKHLNMETT